MVEEITTIRIKKKTKALFDKQGYYGENADDILLRLIKNQIKKNKKEECAEYTKHI